MPRKQINKNHNDDLTIKKFITLLDVLPTLFEPPLGYNHSLVAFIKGLRAVLAPHKSMTGDTLLSVLRESLSATNRPTHPKPERSQEISVDPNAPIEDIKAWLATESPTRQQLITLAQHRFSISASRVAKRSLADIKAEVQNAIQNAETLDAITRLASRERARQRRTQ